jgi:REP element-mobilizing transposase RayT
MGREDRAPTLGQIIAYFKYQSTKTNNPPGSIIQIWQRNFYEHIIRSEPELVNIRKYISNNPISWNHDPNNPLQPL